jgi:hypothetical protein
LPDCPLDSASHQRRAIATGGLECGQRRPALDLAQRPCGGDAHVDIGIFEQWRETAHCRRVLDLAQRPCRHLPHVGIAVLKRGGHRAHAGTVFDLAERPGGGPPSRSLSRTASEDLTARPLSIARPTPPPDARRGLDERARASTERTSSISPAESRAETSVAITIRNSGTP